MGIMNGSDLEGKRITVMGIGLHGGAVSMIEWLLGQGARVTATDMKSEEDLAPSLNRLNGSPNLTVVAGRHRIEDFEKADIVINNPAVRWDNRFIRAALDRNVPVEMDSSLFFKLCPSRHIIGVTGTKGKTTTSLLLYEILKAAGKKAVKVGIGQEAVMDKLALVDEDTFVVFELSSWRLSALGRAGISPPVAVVTNIYQDHLNYYGSMAEYVADKRAIFLHQAPSDFVVLNWENEKQTTTPVAPAGMVSSRMYFAEREVDAERCVYIKDDEIRYRHGVQSGSICHTHEIAMRGRHNIGNVLAAAGAAIVLDIEPEDIKRAVMEFKGAPHRLELIRETEGIMFYNDTAATTPEAGLAGINSFREDVWLIAGGSNKNLDLTAFAQGVAAAPGIREVFLLEGAATGELKRLIEKFGAGGKIAGTYPSMDSAVTAACHRCAKRLADNPGRAVILLSPGCASFGMFKNEFDRGDKFRAAVAAINEASLLSG